MSKAFAAREMPASWVGFELAHLYEAKHNTEVAFFVLTLLSN